MKLLLSSTVQAALRGGTPVTVRMVSTEMAMQKTGAILQLVEDLSCE